MKKILTFLLLAGILTSSISLRAFAREQPIHTYVQVATSHDDYIAAMNKGTVEVNGVETPFSSEIILFDEISCLGIFEGFWFDLYDDPTIGPYYEYTFLTPGYRIALYNYPYVEEKMPPEQEIPLEAVGEQITDIDLPNVSDPRSYSLQIDKLHYSLHYSHDYDPSTISEAHWEFDLCWVLDGWVYQLVWSETDDTSPLFDRMTDEQLGEMQAFREGLHSKEHCVATMEAVNYRPGLLGTGMKIEEPLAESTASVEEESLSVPSAEETVPDESMPEPTQSPPWIPIAATAAIVAVALVALAIGTVYVRRKR